MITSGARLAVRLLQRAGLAQVTALMHLSSAAQAAREPERGQGGGAIARLHAVLVAGVGKCAEGPARLQPAHARASGAAGRDQRCDAPARRCASVCCQRAGPAAPQQPPSARQSSSRRAPAARPAPRRPRALAVLGALTAHTPRSAAAAS